MQPKRWVLKKNLRGRLRTSSKVGIIQFAKQESPGKRLVEHLSIGKYDDIGKKGHGCAMLLCFFVKDVRGTRYKHW
jgi:hypothetical protein